MEEEEKLLLVRRLLPPLRLTRGRLDGITARDKGGGGAGTRDGYEYILVSNININRLQYSVCLCSYCDLWTVYLGKNCIGKITYSYTIKVKTIKSCFQCKNKTLVGSI